MTSGCLEDYDVGRVLGAGTVGTIYEAIDRETGQKVAIKKLHPGVSQDRLIRTRFRREMLVMDRLSHPNIVRFFGGGENEGQLYYVMELVDGGTVKELLQSRGAFQWPVVVEIGRQVCSALQFAHNHGVVHRDLKPGNLFLTIDGDIKLGDFGIARDLRGADITTSGMTVGTHAYMAPEQIQGASQVTGKADLYSLGCCLFEMLIGRPPFEGDTFAQLFEQHLKARPPRVQRLLPQCPEDLDEVIASLLAKSPDDRPFNARQVQAVMLRMADESHEDGVSRDAGGGTKDVAAAAVDGREILKRQIRWRIENETDGEVGWVRLAALVLVIALVVLAVSFLQR